ncbi:MAG: hypothetical protein HKN79_08410 [Flavobacteriales bacterium]|nr:hypothetical protein [Flavobacteriales bacterium]
MTTLDNRLHLFDLRFYRAVEHPEISKEFQDFHQKELAKMKLDGMEFSNDTWMNNPHVFIMVLRNGDRMVGGSRIHLFHPEHPYPFEMAMDEQSPEKKVALERYMDKLQAEWCGLWLNTKFKGLGLAETMNRAAIGATHAMGLDIIFGICPRHTMDLFRTGGFRFMTLNDEVISFPYPTADYVSYIIECEVKQMIFTFRTEKSLIKNWLESPVEKVESKGLLGDCIVQLNGFPELHDIELSTPSSKSRSLVRSNLYKFSKRFFNSDRGLPRAS